MKKREIAQKIVDKYGAYEKVDHEPLDELDEARTVHTIRIVESPLGFVITFHDSTKEGVNNQAIDYFEKALEDGDLVLADSWAEDNLSS